jgi:hypothetical protein
VWRALKPWSSWETEFKANLQFMAGDVFFSPECRCSKFEFLDFRLAFPSVENMNFLNKTYS